MQEKAGNEKFSAEMHHLFFPFLDKGLSTPDLSPVSPCLPFYPYLLPVCH
jgi:hypothetical protein